MNIVQLRSRVRRSAALALGFLCTAGAVEAQRAALQVQVPVLPASATDQGQVPQAAAEQFTLYLQPSADRVTALKAFLVAVQTPGTGDVPAPFLVRTVVGTSV